MWFFSLVEFEAEEGNRFKIWNLLDVSWYYDGGRIRSSRQQLIHLQLQLIHLQYQRTYITGKIHCHLPTGHYLGYRDKKRWRLKTSFRGYFYWDPNYVVKCQNKGELDSPSGEDLKNVLVWGGKGCGSLKEHVHIAYYSGWYSICTT